MKFLEDSQYLTSAVQSFGAQVLTEKSSDSPIMAGRTTNKAWVCFTAVLCRKLTATFGKFDLDAHCQVIIDLKTMESINDIAILHVRNILSL
jgi:hypothetical protein